MYDPADNAAVCRLLENPHSSAVIFYVRILSDGWCNTSFNHMHTNINDGTGDITLKHKIDWGNVNTIFLFLAGVFGCHCWFQI